MNNKEKRVTLTTEYGDIEIKTTSPDDKIKLILTVNKNSNHFQVDEKISITYPSFTSFFDIVSNLDFDIANAIDKLKKDKDIDECIKFDLVTVEDLKEQPNLVRSSLIESGRVIVALKTKLESLYVALLFVLKKMKNSRNHDLNWKKILD